MPRVLKSGFLYLMLFTLGFFSGAIIISQYTKTSFLNNLLGGHPRTLSYREGGTLAAASCVPENDGDHVFFISCGGIY